MNRAYTLVMAFAIAPMLFLACTKSETGNGNKDELEFHHITLTAGSTSDNDEATEGTGSKCLNGEGADGISTKAIFVGGKDNTDFYWQATDKIGVLASGSESLYKLDIEARSENLKTATFGGEIKGELGSYAVYPYNENHKISGNTLTYHLPSEYDFSFTDMDADYLDSSDNVDSYRMSANPALLAKITADGENEDEASCEFKHLGGLLCIKFDVTGSRDFEVTIVADRQISGDFSVDLTSGEPPVIKTTSEATADADVIGTNNYVTIKGLTTNYSKGCVCYIPMPVGEYNLRVRFGVTGSASYGDWFRISPVKSLEMERCSIKRASLTTSTLHKNGGYMLVNGIKYIDLGLPSGKLWATTNVGATLPADYGNFYNWEDANSALGSKKCHIPTLDECNELIENTELSAVKLTNSAGETKNAMMFTSKTNGNSVYFPFTGYYNSWGYQHENEVGTFWLSTPNGDYISVLSVQVDHDNDDKNKAETDGRADKTSDRITLRPIVTP